jgi:hypothetical protein
MKRTTIAGAILFALVLFAAPSTANAQACSGTSVSQNCTLTAQVTVQAVLTCSVLANFNFGSHPSSAGVLGSNETNHGRIRCQANPQSHVNISFTLASSLTNGAYSVPVSYGSEAARAYACDGSCGPTFAFNPATGTTGFNLGAAGILTLALGENGSNIPETEVSVNIAGVPAGTYTGQIIATVVLQ